MPPDPTWSVIVLAGDRGPSDPVAQATGAPCKAMAQIAGRPLLARVLDTIRTSPHFSDCRVVGPETTLMQAYPALGTLISEHGGHWIAPAHSPAASAVAALDSMPPDRRVLITTADHALLAHDMIDAMCRPRTDLDLGVGLIERAVVHQAYPDSRRTAIRLGGGAGYCGCNLFALHSARGRQLVERWRRVEAQRKHPARVVGGMLGWRSLLYYAMGRLTLESAFERLSARQGLRVRPILLTNPRAAVDVDSVADLHQVETILRDDGA